MIRYITYFKKYFYLLSSIIIFCIIIFIIQDIFFKSIPETTVLKFIELKNTGTIFRDTLKYNVSSIISTLLVYFTVPILIFFLYNNIVNISRFLNIVSTFILRLQDIFNNIISYSLNNVSLKVINVNYGFINNMYALKTKLYTFLKLDLLYKLYEFFININYFLILLNLIVSLFYKRIYITILIILYSIITFANVYQIINVSQYLLEIGQIIISINSVIFSTSRIDVISLIFEIIYVCLCNFYTFVKGLISRFSDLILNKFVFIRIFIDNIKNTIIFTYLSRLLDIGNIFLTYLLQYDYTSLYNFLNYKFYIKDINDIIKIIKRRKYSDMNKALFSNLNIGLIKFKEDFTGVSLIYYDDMRTLYKHCSEDKTILDAYNTTFFCSDTNINNIESYMFSSPLQFIYNNYNNYIDNVETTNSFIVNNVNKHYKTKTKIQVHRNYYIINNIDAPKCKIIYVDPNYMPFFEHLSFICKLDDFRTLGTIYLELLKSKDLNSKILDVKLPSGTIIRTIHNEAYESYIKYLKILIISYFYKIYKMLKVREDSREFLNINLTTCKTKHSELSYILTKVYSDLYNPLGFSYKHTYYYNRSNILKNIKLLKNYQ